MVESSEKPIVIYTDHDSTKGIIGHTHLVSSAVDKPNNRLIRASQYLSQFRLDIRHRPGISNHVADGLSRLPSNQPCNESSNILDEILDFDTDADAFSASHVEIDSDYADSLLAGYRVDPTMARIWQAVESGKEYCQFVKMNDLLFFRESNGASIQGSNPITDLGKLFVSLLGCSSWKLQEML